MTIISTLHDSSTTYYPIRRALACVRSIRIG